MSNELMTTNRTWYKIKSFLKRIFIKEEKVKNYSTKEKKRFMNDDDLKETLNKENQNKILAGKLLSGEVSSHELEDKQLDEMIEYMKKDIQNIDDELLKIRNHIIEMQKELKK